ncbi:Spartin [Nymphon striatum]|nr:Spartin [Nymphon striatum]
MDGSRVQDKLLAGQRNRDTKKLEHRDISSRDAQPEAPPRPTLPNSRVHPERNGAEASSRPPVPSNSAGAGMSEVQSTLPNENELILPSYAEACGENNLSNSLYPNVHSVRISSARNTRNLSDLEVNNFLDSMLNEHVEREPSSPSTQEILDVLLTISNVQIYFISPSGMVSAPSYPDALRILSSGNSDSALLQVGSWTYPLLVGQSPTLQCDTGCYIFPDISSQEPGSSVGLILPNAVTVSERQLFESLMKDLTAMHTQALIPSAPPQEREASKKTVRTSDRISEGLAKGGELIGFGLSKGAEQTTRLIRFGALKIKEKLVPESKPTTIDPRVQKSLNVVKDTSIVAVVATGFLISKLGDATMALGRALAPHIEKYGSEMISKASGAKKEESKDTIDNVMTVAVGGLKGFAAVYLGLESAGKILAKSMTDETVQIVDKKYGKEAAAVAGTSLNSAVNIALAARNITAFGPKAIVKRTAKDAGKAVVQEYNTNRTLH